MFRPITFYIVTALNNSIQRKLVLKTKKFKGLMAAPFTPLTKNAEVDTNKIAEYASYLTTRGVKGAFISGTSGEGTSLSVIDRKLIAKAWKDHCSSDFSLFIQVGHTCLEDSCAMASHAELLGVDAISTMAPLFFKPKNIKELISYCKTIADSAPNTPFYYYHIPNMTGVNYPMRDFIPLAAKHIPSFAGIKFTSEDLRDFSLCQQIENGRFDLLWAVDDAMTAAMSVGCQGFIGSTFNYGAAKYLEVIETFNNAQITTSAKAQLEMNKIVDVLIKSPLPAIATQRILMAEAGLDCSAGNAPSVYDNYCVLRQQVVDALKETQFYQMQL